MENKIFETFSKEYKKEEKEILILTSNIDEGASYFETSCVPYRTFLAYVDIESNELIKGKGDVKWFISEEQSRKHGISWPYNFKGEVIYRLKVRELINKKVINGKIPPYYNNFMVVDVIEENCHHNKLLNILIEYRKPIKISDELLGEFELDKDLNIFEGNIKWLDENIPVSLYVDVDDSDSYIKAINVLHTLFKEQKQKDSEFRTFAATILIEAANDWLFQSEFENITIEKLDNLDDDDIPKISNEDFQNRIVLCEIGVDPHGDYYISYNDDNMFEGHQITVRGNLEKGLKEATI